MANLDVMYSSKTDQWATPQEFFNELNAEFAFDLDPCADEKNHKCETFFTKEENGLLKDWGGASRLLQSTIRPKNNGRMDPEVLRRSEEARNGCRCTYSGAH